MCQFPADRSRTLTWVRDHFCQENRNFIVSFCYCTWTLSLWNDCRFWRNILFLCLLSKTGFHLWMQYWTRVHPQRRGIHEISLLFDEWHHKYQSVTSGYPSASTVSLESPQGRRNSWPNSRIHLFATENNEHASWIQNSHRETSPGCNRVFMENSKLAIASQKNPRPTPFPWFQIPPPPPPRYFTNWVERNPLANFVLSPEKAWLWTHPTSRLATQDTLRAAFAGPVPLNAWCCTRRQQHSEKQGNSVFFISLLGMWVVFCFFAWKPSPRALEKA